MLQENNQNGMPQKKTIHNPQMANGQPNAPMQRPLNSSVQKQPQRGNSILQHPNNGQVRPQGGIRPQGTPQVSNSNAVPQQMHPQTRVVQTDVNAKNGQTKCPSCGATDISTNTKTGMLRCNFCRYQFKPDKVDGFEKNLDNLQGTVLGSGTRDINRNSEASLITLKCTSCGAEVVINASDSAQSKCPWCRNFLSVNEQIANGIQPDVLLPFAMKKDEARELIENFVGKRQFFAHPKFKKEFTTENIMGIYYPYMIVDANAYGSFEGEGEILIRKYTVGSKDHKHTEYDADAYNIGRDFDIAIDGLTIESSLDKLKESTTDTNNIINSILPFDVENVVQFDANYMRGFTSEKRDMNVSEIEPFVDKQLQDVVRNAATEASSEYDRGVCWKKQNVDIRGKQWKSAYLPVWLYSYYQENNGLLHYVAVNARTKETQGSVPIHKPKLILVSFILEMISVFLSIVLSTLFTSDDNDGSFYWILVLAGFIFYFYNYTKYRNQNARHHFENETKRKISNLRKYDNMFKHRTGLRNDRIENENGDLVQGATHGTDGKSILNNVVPLKDVNLLNNK